MPAIAELTPDDIVEATWPDILPYFNALAIAPLTTGTVDAWLADWSALEVAVGEASQVAMFAAMADTTDQVKQAASERLNGEIGSRLPEQRARLGKRLLDLGYERQDLAPLLRTYRLRQSIARPENAPLLQEDVILGVTYQKLTGAMTAPWDGDDLPLPRLRPFLLDPDRSVRERAFRLKANAYLDQRDAFADLVDAQYRLRQEVAQNAGFATYRDYAFVDKGRTYSPAECEAFHDAIAETVVPALNRRYARRRGQLGVATLRPWDLEVDPEGRPPLHPCHSGAELAAGVERIFRRVDPDFGDMIATMQADGLLDLDSRQGKAPGGMCGSFQYRQRPVIFMNANGTHVDVTTLVHEGGHAIHDFETYGLPFMAQRFPDMEMSEVGSMAMELLALPYLAADEGGFYGADDAQRAQIEMLERTLTLFPWIAHVDAFQHWLYTSGEGHDRDARDAAWLRLGRRFNPGLDWNGLEAEDVARWYALLHIFLVPFYFIEYAIAELGALQIWRNSLVDQAAAVAAYRQALQLGNTRPLAELFAAAGARFAFDRATLAELVGLVEEHLERLED